MRLSCSLTITRHLRLLIWPSTERNIQLTRQTGQVTHLSRVSCLFFHQHLMVQRILGTFGFSERHSITPASATWRRRSLGSQSAALVAPPTLLCPPPHLAPPPCSLIIPGFTEITEAGSFNRNNWSHWDGTSHLPVQWLEVKPWCDITSLHLLFAALGIKACFLRGASRSPTTVLRSAETPVFHVNASTHGRLTGTD